MKGAWPTVSELLERAAPAQRVSLEREIARIRRGGQPAPAPAIEASPVKAPTSRRSKTEERYEERLITLGFDPRYEAIRLRIDLPTGVHHYKADFYLDLEVPELHEVKGGYPRDRDWMRFEMAVSQWGHLFTFVWAKWSDDQWNVRRFERRARG